MALQTKSIYKNGNKDHHRFTLKITENSTNSSNNTSSISWSFILSAVEEGYDWYYSSTVPVSYIVTINGEEFTGNIMSYDGSSDVTVRSGSMTITHNADGSKNLDFGFEAFSLNSIYLTGYASATGTMALTNIPRNATLTSAPNFSDEDNPTITYSNPLGNNVKSLEAAIYNSSGTQSYIPYKSIEKTKTSYKFELTDAERSNLYIAAQSNTLPIRFYIRTTIGDNTYLSYLDRTFSINDANPIITANVTDVNSVTIALTGDSNKLVRYYSDAHAVMSVEPQKGATINESLCIIRNGNTTAYTTERYVECVEDNEFTFIAEDNRGNIGTAYVTPEMIPYVKLTCNVANNRPDALGNMTVACSGNYFNDSFGAVANTLTVQYRYCVLGSASYSAWSDMDVTKNGNSYYASKDFVIPNFDQQLYYTFEIKAADKLATIQKTGGSVKSTPMFHWGENDFVFEVPVTFNAGVVGATSTASTESDTYEGSKTITGNLRLKGTGNYGNHLLFGDSNYCYIAELTDDVMTIHANKIYLDASSGVYVDDKAIPILDKGIWTPSLNSSAVSSYTTQYGWYSKMGQSVTVGFFIKATCKSGYSSTAISISGLPFTPLYSAAGGGMCSGAYVSGGFNFQCFVADTSKSITTRVQSCNHTSQTNLSTSASGCWYPSGGGEVTLSGTISFIANS